MNPLDEIQFPDVDFDLRPRIALLARAGSESHGTRIPSTDPNSIDDRDVVGVVVPPRRALVGLSDWDNANSIKGCWDVVLHAFPKFCRMLRQQNPNALSALWVDERDVLHASGLGRALRGARSAFRAAKPAYGAFCGYARGQLEDMHRHGDHKRRYMGEKRAALVEFYGYDVKNASHLIRLLRMGAEYQETGILRVDRTGIDSNDFVAIKKGEYALDDVMTMAAKLFERCNYAFQHTVLPRACDDDIIEELLMQMWREELRAPA